MRKSFSEKILEYFRQRRQDALTGRKHPSTSSKMLTEGFYRLRDAMYPWSNRRQNERVRMSDALVTLTEENGRMHAGNLKDISLGGVFVKTRDLLDTGLRLAVDIRGDAGNRLYKNGVVLRHARSGIAMEWTGNSNDVAEFLAYRKNSPNITY